MLNKIKRILRIISKAEKDQLLRAEEERKINELCFGKNSHFHGNNKVENSTIGCHSYVSFNSIIYNCEIGNYCSIGPNVVIGYGNHPYQYISTSPFIYLNQKYFAKEDIESILQPHFEKVLIKNDVWIGSNVYIKNGVTIGNGAIIGAGAVVTKDVNDFEIVVGVPARVVKKRFSEPVINLINQFKWWELDVEKLSEFREVIKSPTEQNLSIAINKLNDK